MSVVLPTGNRDRSLGDGTVGLQFNLPVSKQLNDWYVHWNGGLTWLPRAQGELRERHGRARTAQSRLAVRRRQRDLPAQPMLNLMLESVCRSTSRTIAGGTTRTTTVHAVARIPRRVERRRGSDRHRRCGAISWTEGTRDTGVFLYFSYELPFKK